jgi:RNA polymerase sigma factor (sigma-70 family)
MTNQSPEDARLVQSVIAGDRQSFEEIVHRYRNLVCSIAYSGTGDFALSEDLAQNTFLAAWRDLAELREPRNLRAWLSAIVRRTAAGAMRTLARRPKSVPLPPDAAAAGTAEPAEQLIFQEERALVWQTLLQLPETYREPLILFYREEQSVRRVAEDLGLSEEAVKQRLSRGRQLLSERVMAVVEKTLRDSAPSRVFVAGVMAALPALAPQAVSAGMIAVGGKGSAVAKAALLGGTASAVLGPVLGLLGGLVGVWAGMRSAKSPRERRLMIRVGLLVFGYIALLNILLAAAYALSYIVSMTVTWIVLSVLGLLYLGGFVWLAAWAARRQRQIRVETHTDQSPEEELAKLSRRSVTGAFAGATLGSVLWILLMAIGSADWTTAAVVAGIALLIFVTSLLIAFHEPGRFYRVSIAMTLALAALNFGVVNLRWTRWVARVLSEGAADGQLAFPLWALNLLLGGIFTMVLTSLIYKSRHSYVGVAVQARERGGSAIGRTDT